MKFILGVLLALFVIQGCSSVTIIDANPDNPAVILKSEMSGLSPSQTNTRGSWQSSLDYVNKKLKYGEKFFYSTTFKKFVYARFSNEYLLFELDELDFENATIRRQGLGSKKGSTNNSLSIPEKNKTQGFEHIFASGKRSTSPQLLINVDSASDSIKVKQALKLLSEPSKQRIKTEQ